MSQIINKCCEFVKMYSIIKTKVFGFFFSVDNFDILLMKLNIKSLIKLEKFQQNDILAH